MKAIQALTITLLIINFVRYSGSQQINSGISCTQTNGAASSPIHTIELLGSPGQCIKSFRFNNGAPVPAIDQNGLCGSSLQRWTSLPGWFSSVILGYIYSGGGICITKAEFNHLGGRETFYTQSVTTTDVSRFFHTWEKFYGFSGCAQSIPGTCNTNILEGQTTTPPPLTCPTTTILDSNFNTPVNMSAAALTPSGFTVATWNWIDTYSKQQNGHNLCGQIIYTYSVTSAPAGYVSGTIFSINQSLPGLNIAPSSNLDAGNYVVSITGSLSSNSSISATMTQQIWIQPCTPTSITSITDSSGNATNSYNPFIPNPISTLWTFQFKAVNNCGYAILPSAWTSLMTSNNDAYHSHFSSGLDTTSGLYTVWPFSDTCYNGAYDLNITSVTLNSVVIPTNLVTRFIVGDVSSPGIVCSSNVLTPSSISIPNFKVTVYDTTIALFGPFDQFTDSISARCPNACGPFTYSIVNFNSTTFPTVFTIDSSRKFNLQSNDRNHVGYYSAEVKGCLTNYPTVCAATYNFPLTINDPCIVTVIQPPSAIPPQSIQVISQSIPNLNSGIFNDTLSLTQTTSADASGYYCKARAYSISSSIISGAQDNLQTSNELLIDSATGVISIATNRATTVGVFNVIVFVFLTTPTLTQISGSMSFQLTVNPCYLQSVKFFASTTLATQNFTILQSITQTWNFNTANLQSTPNCQYQYSFVATSYPSLSYLQQSYSSGTIFNFVTLVLTMPKTPDRSVVGAYNISIQPALASYYYTSQSPQPFQPQSFTLNLIDPCLSTQINGGPVENFYAFAGYTMISTQIYNFTDTVELQANVSNYCGLKEFTFKIDGVTTTQLAGQNEQNITFSPPKNSPGKTQIAQLEVKLGTFAFKIIDFSVTTISYSVPIILNQTYVLGSYPIAIPFSDFHLQPISAQKQSNQEQYFAYLSKNSLSLKYPLDVSQLQDLPQWITLDVSNSTNLHMIVKTNSSSDVGNHQIVLCKVYPSFGKAIAFTSFFVQIFLTVNLTSNNAPQFQQPLNNQYIEQCSSNRSCDWFYQLPPTSIDSQGGYVTSITAVFNPAVLSYDSQNSRLNQVICVDKPNNYTVDFYLTNNRGRKAQYSMVVEFGCKLEGSKQFRYNQSLYSAFEKLKFQKQSPTAYITSIDLTGLMQIHFDTTMKPPKNLSDIKNSTMLINETIWPAIDLYIVPGKYSDPKMLNFTWEPVSFSPGQLSVQLTFENPNFVSSLQNLDKIGITVYAFYLFADFRGNLMQPESVLKPRVIPKQISSAQSAQVALIGSSTESTVASAFVANIFVSFLIAGPLQHILSAVKQLQLSSIIMLVNITPPANAQMFYSILMNIVTMNLIDCTDFFNNFFKLDDDGNTGLSDTFGTFGYGSFYVIQNFGTLTWQLFLLPIIWFVCKVINYIFKKKFDEMMQKFDNFMFFNGTFTFLDGEYLLLAISVALNTYYFRWDTFGNAINSLLCAVIGFFVVITPFLFYFLFSKQSAVQKIVNHDQKFLDRFGELLEPLNFLRRGTKAILYLSLNQIRRLVLVLTVVYLQDYPLIFSIISINFQTLAMIIISGYLEPFVSKTSNRMDLLNECFILTQTYQIMCFTNFLYDPDMQSQVGMSLIVIQCSNIVFNILVVTFQTAQQIIWGMKLRWLQRKFRVELKNKQKNRQKELLNLLEERKLINQKINVADFQNKKNAQVEQKVKQNQIHFNEAKDLPQINEESEYDSEQISSENSVESKIQNQSNLVQNPNANNNGKIQNQRHLNDKNVSFAQNRLFPDANQGGKVQNNLFDPYYIAPLRPTTKTPAEILLEKDEQWVDKYFLSGQEQVSNNLVSFELDLDLKPYQYFEALAMTQKQPQPVQCKTIPDKKSMYETITEMQRKHELQRSGETNILRVGSQK